MKRLVILAIILLFIGGCTNAPENVQIEPVTEEQVRTAITELVNGINAGNIEVVEKYLNNAGPIAQQLVEKFKDNIKLSAVRDVSIQGTTATATVTLEIVPLEVKKDVTLNFDVVETIIWNNPIDLLSIFIQ